MTTTETVETMKALPSMPCRKLVFIIEWAPPVSKTYSFKYGSEYPADGVSVIAPNDNLGRFFEFNL